PRSVPEGLCAVIDRAAVKVLPIFELIARTGNISERDMFNTFNMGVGMCITVARGQEENALEVLRAQGEDAYIIGEIAFASGEERIVIR
ncbi:MAG: phosphoribosylformylglycinamidine cyclo-ligase, partial [Clostridia bacterium]|nr:phosphoribosylformylglycinamidine cyclo-ligase [Clostridia bacterium]